MHSIKKFNMNFIGNHTKISNFIELNIKLLAYLSLYKNY